MSDETVSCNLGDIAGGASAIVDVAVTAPPAALLQIDNTATVSSDSEGPDDSDNTTIEPTLVFSPGGSPTLDGFTVTKADDVDPVAVGGTLTYTVTVINDTSQDVAGATLVDPLPGGVTFVSVTPSQGNCAAPGGGVICAFGPLAAGSSAWATIVVTAPSEPGVVTNTATVVLLLENGDETVITDRESTTVVPGGAETEFDCDKSLYITNEGNGGGGTTVVRADCGGNITTYATGFTGPSGLAFDDATGNLIISDDLPGIHSVDTASNVTPVAANVAFTNPNGLEIDAAGRLLVADTDGRILRLVLNPDLSAASVEVLAQGFAIPQGVVETPGGVVLFTDIDGWIYRITPSTTLPISAPATAQRLPVGQIVSGNQGSIKLDAAGNIYTSNFGWRIVRITPDGQTSKDVVNIPQAPCPPGQSGGLAAGLPGAGLRPRR